MSKENAIYIDDGTQDFVCSENVDEVKKVSIEERGGVFLNGFTYGKALRAHFEKRQPTDEDFEDFNGLFFPNEEMVERYISALRENDESGGYSSLPREYYRIVPCSGYRSWEDYEGFILDEHIERLLEEASAQRSGLTYCESSDYMICVKQRSRVLGEILTAWTKSTPVYLTVPAFVDTCSRTVLNEVNAATFKVLPSDEWTCISKADSLYNLYASVHNDQGQLSVTAALVYSDPKTKERFWVHTAEFENDADSSEWKIRFSDSEVEEYITRTLDEREMKEFVQQKVREKFTELESTLLDVFKYCRSKEECHAG